MYAITISPCKDGFWKAALVVLLIAVFTEVKGQLRPLSATHYFNGYLQNPALAGLDPLWHVNMGLRQQFPAFRGAPQTQAITLDKGFTEKSGVGIRFANDKAGVLGEMYIGASYAYHLPLAQAQYLDFGLLLSVSDYRLNKQGISGDLNDPDLVAVDNRKPQVDSEFGIAYRSPSATLQAILPKLVSQMGRRTEAVDYTWLVASASYRWVTSNAVIEPKVFYRSVKGYTDLVDVSTQVTFNSSTGNDLGIFGTYHSARYATLGFSLDYAESFKFMVGYTIGTTATSRISAGELEVGLGLAF